MFLSLLPVVCFLLLWILFGQKGQKIRSAFLTAAVVWGSMVVLGTQGLSAVHGITRPALACFWGIGCVVASGLVWRDARRVRPGFARQWVALILSNKFATAILVIFVLLTGVVAWISPPNTWDSMTYHMTRVAQWASNRSISFYPTFCMRQNIMPPWAEWAILQFYVLAEGDRMANMVQWFSMVGCLVGVSGIAGQLGVGRRAQWLAAVLCVTLPMGLMQSTNTQNDYVVSFWLVCSVYFLLLARQEHIYGRVIWASLAAGLALLTKGTAYLYLLPLAGMVGGCVLWRQRQRAIACLLLALTIVVALNLPHYVRNQRAYGHPLGQRGYFTNEQFSIPVMGANLVRNAALHLGTPWPALNVRLTGFLNSLLGEQAGNPASTWPRTTFEVPSFSLHEDTAGNLLHLFLCLLGMALLWSRRPAGAGRWAQLYVAGVVAGALLFCLLLKWQPWASRLHLPLFVLSAPAVAVGLTRAVRPRPLAVGLMVILAIMALPWLLCNRSRPLITLSGRSMLSLSRLDLYFTNNPGVRESVMGAAQELRRQGVTTLGLASVDDDWEYILWVLLKPVWGDDLKIVAVNPQGGWAPVPYGDATPRAVVSTQELGPSFCLHGKTYQRTFTSTPYCVYSMESNP